MIDPINTVPTALEYLYLENENPKSSHKLDIQLLNYLIQDYHLYKDSLLTPQEITHKIMKTNALEFLKEYFV